MTSKILVTKFRYNLPHAEFRNLLFSVSEEFAKVPGCEWKIWLIDEEKNEGGAVYLFDDEAALDAFKECRNYPLLCLNAALWRRGGAPLIAPYAACC